MTDPSPAPIDAGSPTDSRAALDAAAVTGLPAGWQLRAVAETVSTNADLIEAAATGAAHQTVLVAELQTGGRGRLERSWSSPAGAGLTFSMLLRPGVAPAGWGWLPLLAGLALCETVGEPASLKWPNDLLLGPDGGKVAGILAQATGEAAVIGIGLNVTTTQAELPVPTATSLALQGYRQLDRAGLLVAFLGEFDQVLADWQAAAGDAEAAGLAQRYRQRCGTLGHQVRLEQGGTSLIGEAVAIDASGQLVVRTADGSSLAVAAGDITHVRPISR